MPITGQQIQEFGTVNAVRSPDKLEQNEVQSATNIDFSYTDGGAAVRQGSVRVITIGTADIDNIYRYYNKSAHGDSPWYVMTGGGIYRVTGGFGSPSVVGGTITTGGSSDENDLMPASAYRGYVHIASGAVNIKDDGTNAQPWVKPRPTTKVVAAASVLTPLTVVSTYTVSEAVTAQVDTTYVGTATADTNQSTFRLELNQVPAATNLNVNGTNTIGNLGVHHIDLKFDEPKFVTRVSLDYSIGDTTYTNYFHTEFDVEEVADAIDDTEVLLEEELEIVTDINAALDDIAEAKATARRQLRPAKRRVSTAKNTFNTISIPVTQLEFVGKSPGTGLANIQAVRLIVETWGPVNVEVRDWVIQGSENYPLHAPNNGYSYWETWAAADGDGNVLSESAPSPISDAVKMVGAQAIVTSPNASPGAWATHRILYRRGGRLQSAYAVSTNTVSTGTYTDTLSDIKALLNNSRLQSNIRTSLPQGIRAISEPYKDRLFVGYDNKLLWTLPGNPDAFPLLSEAVISHENDRIQAIYSWGDSLVIVNRDSIYELRGNVFEGQGQDWVLRKTGATGGSYAARATVKTPYGILLVRADGLFIYTPGQGLERPIAWAMDKMRDIFRGNDTTDPMQEKGSRMGVGMNQAGISHCVAAYHDEFIWFGWPNGNPASGQDRPNLIAKLDMRKQQISVYEYPQDWRTLWGDRDSNALIAGTVNGDLVRLNIRTDDYDGGGGGGTTGIPWSLKTRRWTVPNDTVYENLQVEYEGDVCQPIAIHDSTNTHTMSTISGSQRDWHNPSFKGTFAQTLDIQFSGTQTSNQSILYNLVWDAIAHPYRRHYWRTEHFDNNHDGDKIFHVFYSDIESFGTGNVFATVYVDNTAVMTQTIASPTSDRQKIQTSFPLDTVGEIAYAIYTSTSDSVEFKLWETQYTVENEPPKLTSLKTPVESLEEHLVEAVDFDVNPGGTCTVTAFVDNTAVQTSTIIGTNRQSYTEEIPINEFGRTVYAIYSGGPFKHYKTWWHLRKEPDRWENYQWGPEQYLEERLIKTWAVELDPLGQTVIGTFYADDVAILTQTFTGNGRKSHVIALDLDGSNNIREASKVEVDYTSSGDFKHYKTVVESEPKPFDKTQWAFDYFKVGGASELDIAESYFMDVEVPTGTATITATWDVDGRVFDTQTLTFTGREWRDKIAPPPGMRGMLFRLKLKSSSNFRVWTTGLNLVRFGRKGVVIVTRKGTPQ